MKKILLVIIGLSLLSAGCSVFEDEQTLMNDRNIREYKKCQYAGMEVESAHQSFALYCVPKK